MKHVSNENENFLNQFRSLLKVIQEMKNEDKQDSK